MRPKLTVIDGGRTTRGSFQVGDRVSLEGEITIAAGTVTMAHKGDVFHVHPDHGLTHVRIPTNIPLSITACEEPAPLPVATCMDRWQVTLDEFDRERPGHVMATYVTTVALNGRPVLRAYSETSLKTAEIRPIRTQDEAIVDAFQTDLAVWQQTYCRRGCQSAFELWSTWVQDLRQYGVDPQDYIADTSVSRVGNQYGFSHPKRRYLSTRQDWRRGERVYYKPYGQRVAFGYVADPTPRLEITSRYVAGRERNYTHVGHRIAVVFDGETTPRLVEMQGLIPTNQPPPTEGDLRYIRQNASGPLAGLDHRGEKSTFWAWD